MRSDMNYEFIFRLEAHPKLTVADIRKYGVNCWSTASGNSAITMNDILNNPDLPWVWRYVTTNPNVTHDYIISHPQYPWDYNMIDINPNTSYEYIQQQPHYRRLYKLDDNDNDYNVRYKYLSCERHFTPNYIINNYDKKWDWGSIFNNPFDGEIIRLQLELGRKRNMFAKEFYWNMITKMSKPPSGYYFLNDLESTIFMLNDKDNESSDRKQLFQQLRRQRRYYDIQQIFLQ